MSNKEIVRRNYLLGTALYSMLLVISCCKIFLMFPTLFSNVGYAEGEFALNNFGAAIVYGIIALALMFVFGIYLKKKDRSIQDIIKNPEPGDYKFNLRANITMSFGYIVGSIIELVVLNINYHNEYGSNSVNGLFTWPVVTCIIIVAMSVYTTYAAYNKAKEKGEI